ncbi:uncharacterized protein C2845_PM03G23410 [Panicum miliaceum]|uniref:Uncharacterized protein n=1 Tax=Panicum miliaceum TaxID=4540 RepID=A0A3L6TD73_PANMI|nr:uncharacterized protein C2845_PM03G23410 [Panicum miliaceum]
MVRVSGCCRMASSLRGKTMEIMLLRLPSVSQSQAKQICGTCRWLCSPWIGILSYPSSAFTQIKEGILGIFPGKWSWELTEHEQNVFITKFPSKQDLQRVIAFGGANVKEVSIQGLRLQFDVWVEKEEGFLLPKVWVRVYGLRKSLREFMNLWAAGSMLGSTQTVDMESTRKNEFGRIQVAVLNPMLIPARLDVVIGDHYFELDFEVEKLGVDENGEEIEVDWKGGEGDGEEEEEEEPERDPSEDRDPKRQKGDDGSGKEGDEHHKKQEVQMNNLGQNLPELKERMIVVNGEEFTSFLRKKANEILDGVVSETLKEIAERVLSEEGDEIKENKGMHNIREVQENETGLGEDCTQSLDILTQVLETIEQGKEVKMELQINSGQVSGA